MNDKMNTTTHLLASSLKFSWITAYVSLVKWQFQNKIWTVNKLDIFFFKEVVWVIGQPKIMTVPHLYSVHLALSGMKAFWMGGPALVFVF